MLEIEYKDSYNKDYTITKEIPLSLYSQDDLVKYGYEKKQNNQVTMIIGLIIFALVVIFWLFQFIDYYKTKMPKYKKLLWFIIFLTGIGALFWLFFGRLTQTLPDIPELPKADQFVAEQDFGLSRWIGHSLAAADNGQHIYVQAPDF